MRESAIVTGASRESGRAAAERLARDGRERPVRQTTISHPYRSVSRWRRCTFAIMDRARAEMLRRVGLADLLVPKSSR